MPRKTTTGTAAPASIGRTYSVEEFSGLTGISVEDLMAAVFYGGLPLPYYRRGKVVFTKAHLNHLAAGPKDIGTYLPRDHGSGGRAMPLMSCSAPRPLDGRRTGLPTSSAARAELRA